MCNPSTGGEGWGHAETGRPLNTLASQPSQINKPRGQGETLTQNLKMKRKEKDT